MEARYLCSLLRSVFNVKPLREWRIRPAMIVPGGVVAIALLFTAFRVPGALGSISFRTRTPTDHFMQRATEVKQAFAQIDQVYATEIEPLETVLMTYRHDARLARRVATALVREGRRAGVKPDILLAVLLVENPWIDPGARSPVGARGLMQVMPGHRGNWKACPNSLDGIESNICYGAQIFRAYLREENGHVEQALLRYNGCVTGSNTPNCHDYPAAVLAGVSRATAARRALLKAAAAD